ncbi:MAG: hypothetical protein HC905_19015 [Bacteroidales bacterium]|nr:hypothetical protein [Bacteroidales bacterium]
MQRDGTHYLSVLLVPGKKTENFSEAKQRGNLHQVWYESPTIGLNRRMFVYTPYGYETSGKKYPVLYLLHGAGGDEDAWTTMGRARQILDNLIEKGLAVPMICVMPMAIQTKWQLKQPCFPKENSISGIRRNRTFTSTALQKILFLTSKRITG